MRLARWAVVGAAVLAALVAPAAAAPSPPPERTPVLPAAVKDAKGERITVKDTRRIVVLNGDIAEIVFALGQGPRVVGTDISATYPEGARALQRIGYQRTLSAEGILPTDDRITDAVSKIRNVARALGVPVRGARLAATTQRQIDAARARLKGVTSRPKVAFLYLRGPRVQLLAGKSSRSDTMILAAGGRDMGSELGIVETRPLTAESLVAAAPEVLVVLDAGLESVGGSEGLMRLPGVAQTPAGQAGRIVSVDDLRFLGLGPRTGPALNELIDALHPELR